MHLQFGYFVLYSPIYRLMERKKVSMYKTIHAEWWLRIYRLCARAPVHDKVVVEFGRKVFLVDCLTFCYAYIIYEKH